MRSDLSDQRDVYSGVCACVNSESECEWHRWEKTKEQSENNTDRLLARKEKLCLYHSSLSD